MSVTQKTAVVTGGASGIGLATCHRLARDGIGIAVWDLDQAGAERTRRSVKFISSSTVRASRCSGPFSNAQMPIGTGSSRST